MRKLLAVVVTVAVVVAGGLLAGPAQAMTTGTWSDEWRAPGAVMDLANGSTFDRSVSAAAVLSAARNRPWNGQRSDGSRVRVFVVDDGISASTVHYGAWSQTASAGEFPPLFAPGYTVSGLDNAGSVAGTNTCSDSHGNSVARAIYTVAPGAVIVPVRVSNCQAWVSDANIAAGLAWVKANGAAGDVVNVSLSGMYYYASTLNEISAAGMVVVVGSNNVAGSNLCANPFGDGSQSSTASQWNSINGVVVSGVITGMTAPFGAGSSCVEVVAPALTDGAGAGSDPGVSMATGLTSGVAAAWSSGNPSESASTIVSRLTSGVLSVSGDVNSNGVYSGQAPTGVGSPIGAFDGDWSTYPTSGRRVRIAGPASGPLPVSATTTAPGLVRLEWNPPLIPGGAITGYTVSVDGTSVSACANLPATQTYCEVTGLAPGSHHAQVRAVNAWGTGAIASTVTSGTPAWEFTAQATPAAPTDVAATPSANHAVTITWTAGSNGGSTLIEYEVLENGTLVATAAGTATSVTLSSLSVGAHAFTLRATNAWGTGAESSPASVSVEGLPGAPVIMSATASGAGAVSVSWTAPASNGGTALTGYEVREGATVLATVTGTSASLTGLSAGSHALTVRATNRWGAGADSASQSVTVQTKPGAPTITSAVASGAAQATLTWTVGSTGGSPLTGYDILETEGQIVSVVATAAAGATSKVVPLNIGLHQLSVRASNAWGDGVASAIVSVNVEILPGTPAGLTLVASGAGAVTATWTAPDDGGTALTGYEIREAGTTVATAGGSATSKVITGLSAGSHDFSIRALNRWGNGPSTSALSVRVEVLPGAVRNVSASSSAAGAATISWTAPVSNGGTALTGYEVREGATVLATVTGTSASLADLTAGSHTLTVHATNRHGAGMGVSEAVDVSTLPGVPAITGVTATSVGALRITWSDATTGGTPLTRYEVLENGTVVVSPSASANSATITGLATGTHNYTVRAVNKWGAGTASNSASGVAEELPGVPTLTTATSTVAGQVDLTWTVPASDGGTALTRVDILKAGTVVATAAGSATSASVTGIATGSHTFTVRVANRWGNSGASAGITVTVTGASAPSGGSSGGGGGGGGSSSGGGSAGSTTSSAGGGGGGALQEITEMRPWKGALAGGYTVAVIGNGFKDATAVTVDGVKTSFKVLSDAHIDIVMPSGKRLGAVSVRVVISAARGDAPADFVYVDDAEAAASAPAAPATNTTAPAATESSAHAASLTATRKATKVTVRLSPSSATSTTVVVTTVPAKATKVKHRKAAYKFTTTVTIAAGKTTATVKLPAKFTSWTGAVRVTAKSVAQ